MHCRANIEPQVIMMIAQGKTNAQIAEQIGIAKKSVDNALTRLYRKYNITSGNKRVKLMQLFSKFTLDK